MAPDPQQDGPHADEPEADIKAADVPLAELIPLTKRTVKDVYFSRLEINIRAIGLLEPLTVYRHEDGQYFILDGYQRYKILINLGQTHAPCLVHKTLDLYTPNRQVNIPSRPQRLKMLERALTVVDETTIKEALGLPELRTGFTPNQLAALWTEVVGREKQGRISKRICYHLMNVTPERQREILALSDQAGDASFAFIRTQVMRTPIPQRVQSTSGRNPWNKATETRKKLIDRLTEAERRHDFYQGLYRQYATDLVRLVSHVRQIVSTKPLREVLTAQYPDDLKFFKKIIEQSGDGDDHG